MPLNVKRQCSRLSWETTNISRGELTKVFFLPLKTFISNSSLHYHFLSSRSKWRKLERTTHHHCWRFKLLSAAKSVLHHFQVWIHSSFSYSQLEYPNLIIFGKKIGLPILGYFYRLWIFLMQKTPNHVHEFEKYLFFFTHCGVFLFFFISIASWHQTTLRSHLRNFLRDPLSTRILQYHPMRRKLKKKL